jgi:hypothetical protein
MPPEWRNWHTQQTQKPLFAVFVRFETLRTKLKQKKKTTSTPCGRFSEFWVIFEAF